MPEMLFHIRWPDGTQETCYSPSLVVRDFFVPGEIYELPDFLARSRQALNIASDRVREKYGVPCSRALAQLARIEAGASGFTDVAEATVKIERFEEP